MFPQDSQEAFQDHLAWAQVGSVRPMRHAVRMRTIRPALSHRLGALLERLWQTARRLA